MNEAVPTQSIPDTRPIDAVITWVDGKDPRHAATRARYLPDGLHPDASAATRFSCRGEIGYSVRSIIRFCPFVRRIFIVTDAQYPSHLKSVFSERPDWHSRIEIVDHQTIYGDHSDLLPVFSSRSIETMIHRIPELAEHFIYLNDDMFIGRELHPEYFFRSGLPLLRGKMRAFPSSAVLRLKSMLRRGQRRAGFKEAQQAAARLVGRRDDYLLAEHHPHAMRRSTIAAFFDDRPSLLRENAGFRFRSPKQVSPIGLANHLELAHGALVEPLAEVGYIKPPKTARDRREIDRTLMALQRGALSALCVQSLDTMTESVQAMVLGGLERAYRFQAGHPSKPSL